MVPNNHIHLYLKDLWMRRQYFWGMDDISYAGDSKSKEKNVRDSDQVCFEPDKYSISREFEQLSLYQKRHQLHTRFKTSSEVPLSTHYIMSWEKHVVLVASL